MAVSLPRRERRALLDLPFGLLRSAARELGAAFPVLIYAAFAQYTLNLTQVRIRPGITAATVLFPLLVLVLCLYAFVSTESRIKQKSRLYLVSAALLCVWLAASFVPTWIDTLSYRGLVRLGEAGTYVVYAALVAHCLRTRGRSVTLLLFGVATLYGFALESGGVTMGFFSERGYDHYIPGLAAPLVTMLDWSNVFYPCIVVVELLQRRWPSLRGTVLRRAFIVALVGVALDLHLDPMATRLGFWHWNVALHPVYLGVPAVNFVAWFYALFGFGVAYYLVERAAWPARRKLKTFVALMPATLLAEGALLLGTMIALEGAHGPTVTIVQAFLRSYGIPL